MMIRFFKRCCILILFVAIVLSVFGCSFSRHVTVQAPVSAPANSTPSLPWQLTLVNRWNGLPENRSFWLKTTADGVNGFVFEDDDFIFFETARGCAKTIQHLWQIFFTNAGKEW